MTKIGYLGPEGTFSEEAGFKYKKLIGKGSYVPFTTIHELLIAVDRSKVSEGIVPIENSIEGTIGIVTDMLVNDVSLKICQEIVIPVKHYLLSKTKIPLNKVTDVVSIPIVLDQCKTFLRTKLPKAKIHFTRSTAEAARKVAADVEMFGKGTPAAIGARSAAKLYGLQIIASEINDYPDNSTRFVVVSKKDHKITGHDKTSIVFSILKDSPGGLYRVLGSFAKRGINLTKIESRPTKRTLGDYYFFVDMQGHKDDNLVADALKEVKKMASFFKVLGSYPRVT
jgi:prephenate dehydratase